MVEELVLPAKAGGSLAVRRITAGDVWDVVFLGSGSEILLGTTDIDYLRDRLTASLDAFLGQDDAGDEVSERQWVLMLASPHTTIYAQASEGLLVLTFFDVDARRRDIELSLGNADARAWRDLVVRFNPPDHLATLGLRR